ncbi:4-diphosphocytidyl-2-C-methyl-D-erythritol kinase [Bienertia sinuspersici]
MSGSSGTNMIDPTSPLYLHPSNRTSSINVEKLQGASNYRPWRRSLEIALASKRKLGLVRRGSTKKSVMFMTDAYEIWRHLESRYSITNGARKYALNKQLFDTKQNGRIISEYYTNLKAIWVEPEALNVLFAMTNMTVEMNRFVQALNEQKEELRLFQFLNELDEDYAPQRSQILMMTKLPSVDEACNMI